VFHLQDTYSILVYGYSSSETIVRIYVSWVYTVIKEMKCNTNLEATNTSL